MSLTRLAVRIAAVQALRCHTLAKERVYNSDATPFEAAVQQQPLPFLVVTTDMHDRNITGRDLAHGDDSLDLVIEASIASKVTLRTSEGEDADEIVIPNTDAGMEFTLDLLEAQAMRALTAQRTEWSRVFVKMVPRITRRISRRGASAETGLRFAARQIVLTCDPIADPVPGETLPEAGAWDMFLSAMKADENLKELEPIIRLHAEGEGVADWERIGELLGITAGEVEAIGLAPGVLHGEGDNEGQPVQLEQIVAAYEDGGPELLISAEEDDDADDEDGGDEGEGDD